MAAGNTYIAIATTTVSSSTATVTLSSIPSTYTDLVLIVNSWNTPTANIDYLMYFNGDTATNYSGTYLEGDGSTAYSGRWSNRANIPVARGTSNTTNTDLLNINLLNYANTTTYKTAISRENITSGVGARVGAIVGLWRSTSAINSISITSSSGSIGAGSTFSLYGILAA